MVYKHWYTGVIRSERHRVLIPWEPRELCLPYLRLCKYLYIVSNPNRDIVPLKWTLYRIEFCFADVHKIVYIFVYIVVTLVIVLDLSHVNKFIINHHQTSINRLHTRYIASFATRCSNG